MKFHYLTSDDGLSENWVQSFCRDHDDYIWIGTGYGLNKFDGYDITIYEHDENQPGSISNNDIRCIFEDSRNNLWVGTADGLNLYNPASDNFTIFRNDTNDAKSLQSNYITCIIEDKNGNVWITAEEGGGLHKWVPEKNIFIRYRIQSTNNNLLINSLTTASVDSENRVWLAGNGLGIYCFNPNTGNFIHYNDTTIYIGDYTEKKLCIDNNDKIWFTSTGVGFFSFDVVTSKFEHFGINIDDKGINSDAVHDIIDEENRHLLIAVDQGGINRFDKITKTFEYIMYDEFNKQGLNTNGVISLYKDKEGILWAGTTRGGVNYYNPELDKFKMFRHSQDPNSIPHNFVSFLYEDSEGLIWVCTNGGGISVYNPKTGNFTNYQHNPNDPYSISGNVIRCVTEDKDHNMWISTWHAGLNMFDKKTKRFYHYFSDIKGPSGFTITNNTIWTMKTDQNYNLWLGGYVGIDVVNTSQGIIIKRFRAQSANSKSLSNNEVTFFYEDKQRNMWICTIDGINFYSFETDSLTVYKDFPDNHIKAFCKDKEGKLWAGSAKKGLFLFEPDGTVVKTYDKTNGLPGNAIRGIIDDNNGNLWITTNRGLSHFDQKKQEFRNYYKNDGLQGNNFYVHSVLRTRDGEIYIGGYNGFNAFHPDSIKDNDFIPQVHITSFKIFNENVPFGVPGSPLKKHISQTKEITLTWQQSVFSFGFTANSFTHPEKNEYAYMMEGFEKEWNYVGNRRDATYTNLDAGKYVFRVIASNNDGVWNKVGASIKINIKPPFWNTWWFRFIIVLLLVIAVYTIYLIRVSSLRNQKKALEIQVEKRTEALKLAYDNLVNISDFGQKVTSKLDYNSINDMIYNYISSFIDNFDFGIGIYDPENDVIEYRMFYENGKLIDPFVRYMSNKNSFSVYCIENQKTIFINDLEKEYKTYMSQLPDFFNNRFPHSLVNIPLTVKQKKIGVLAINSVIKNAFSKGDLLKLHTLAAYIAIALDNAESHAVLLEKNKILQERQKTIEEQSVRLNETNTLLEERQQHIEEQAEELRVQAEKLLVVNEDLKQSNATKDRLFSIIAHDLKNPISPIIGFSELIIRKWDTMAEAKKKLMIESIYTASKSIYSLLENLLQWSLSQMRSIKYNPEDISIFKLTKENADLLSNLIEEKNISLNINVPENLICYADYQMINTVIRNILTNAIKFTDNGTITIDAIIESNIAKITIKDTGMGMPEEKLKNLFEVTKSKSSEGTRGEKGTGLGLIICKEFITKNNGEIYANSQENAGTKIIFTLPLKPPGNA